MRWPFGGGQPARRQPEVERATPRDGSARSLGMPMAAEEWRDSVMASPAAPGRAPPQLEQVRFKCFAARPPPCGARSRNPLKGSRARPPGAAGVATLEAKSQCSASDAPAFAGGSKRCGSRARRSPARPGRLRVPCPHPRRGRGADDEGEAGRAGGEVGGGAGCQGRGREGVRGEPLPRLQSQNAPPRGLPGQSFWRSSLADRRAAMSPARPSGQTWG